MIADETGLMSAAASSDLTPTATMPRPTTMWADSLFHALPAAERDRLAVLLPVVERLDRAPVLKVALRVEATQFAGQRGFSAHSLEMALYRWRASGRSWAALVDKARCPAMRPVQRPCNTREEFVQHVRALAENNQRKAKPAFRALVAAWRNGERIPGYGTWQEWWAVENAGKPHPASVPLPPGWSVRTLYRLLPPARSLKLARQGFLAALPMGASVRRTARNLRAMELLVCDDFRLDVMAYIARQQSLPDGRILKPGVYYVAGLALMEVASRKVIGWCLKLQAPDQEGTRLVIQREDLALLFAQALQQHGLPRDYPITILTENATASFSKEALGVLAARFGGKVVVETTGLLTSKLLPEGWREGGGKYWHKGWIESTFNLLHNEMASLRGQAGSSYSRTPGQLEQAARYTRNTLAAAERHSDRTAEELRLPIMSFEAVTKAFEKCVDERLNGRTDHGIADLEEVVEWRRNDLDVWHPAHELSLLAPAEAAAVEFPPVPRRESPTERFAKLSCASVLEPVPPHATAPLLSIPRPVQVSGGMISWVVRAERFAFFSGLPEVADILRDGMKYLAHWSAWEPETVYLFRPDNLAFAGTLPRWRERDALDKQGLSLAGAETQRVNNRMLAEYRERHGDEGAELAAMREHNTRLLAVPSTGSAGFQPAPLATPDAPKPPSTTRRRRLSADVLV